MESNQILEIYNTIINRAQKEGILELQEVPVILEALKTLKAKLDELEDLKQKP